MSRGTDFLVFVTDKIKKKIGEINEKIQEVQKDIEGMHDYYWENYTEMDQYGYEDFDNRQALLMQVNANQENLKTRHRLRRMLDSPFFGSVDFIYEGEDEPEIFYIGIGNFSQKRGGIPLIYDWRAPVSSLFYDYDKGTASYEAPLGRMEGEILSKWQYKIRGGKMVYEFESDMKIDDDILKQELGENSDTQLKNIVRTIQKEQNAIIRNTKDRILVIQGVAGSGKTSVALHRIAYLLYHDRENLHSSNILILSPNSVFADYISHILPELGEENIQEMSFDLFAYRELKDTVSDCEDRYHQIEKQIQRSLISAGDIQGQKNGGITGREEDSAGAVYRWKQSEEYVRAVEGFLVELEDRLVDIRDVEYKGSVLKAEQILTLFYRKFSGTPLLSRMKAVTEYFVDEYETLHGRELPDDDLAWVQEKFNSMYVTTDLYEIYNWLMEDCGLPPLQDIPPEKRILAYEDVYPILYLKYRLCSETARREIRHLVIDEMQDYSYLQYVILERLFPCSMTILGDRAQTMDERPQDVLRFLPAIFGNKIRRIEMNKSYRNTSEIAEYAKKITSVEGIEYIRRHGKEVEEKKYGAVQDALEEALGRVSLENYETAAVLTMTEDEAREAYQYLKERRGDVFYIDRDSSRFRKGITVTTFYLAKGLEFDQVFVLGGEKDSALFGQFRYICATRALHELYVYGLTH